MTIHDSKLKIPAILSVKYASDIFGPAAKPESVCPSMQLADIVQCRSEQGRDYGVALLPEGLIEFVPEVGTLIAEINEILAGSPQGPLQAVADFLTPASRQVNIELIWK